MDGSCFSFRFVSFPRSVFSRLSFSIQSTIDFSPAIASLLDVAVGTIPCK